MRTEAWISQATGTPGYHTDAPRSGYAGRMMGAAKLKVEAGKLLAQSWRAVPIADAFASDAAMDAWVRDVY